MSEADLRRALEEAEARLDDALSARRTGDSGGIDDPAAEWAYWARKLPTIFAKAAEARERVREARSALESSPPRSASEEGLRERIKALPSLDPIVKGDALLEWDEYNGENEYVAGDYLRRDDVLAALQPTDREDTSDE